MDNAKKIINALIAGYLITLVMLLALTYLIGKFELSEEVTDRAVSVIYIAGSTIGSMLAAWLIKHRRIFFGMLYGLLYIAILFVMASIMHGGTDSVASDMAMTALLSTAAGALGGFVSP